MKISAFTKSYHGRKVLSFPGMEPERGKIYCVIGANGSGKSTFARVLSGIIPADRPGAVLDSGVTVGYLPQKAFAFRMSVRANLLLASRDEARAELLMERLRISQLADKRAKQLSGGETARMALARLLMKNFELLILDEPTAAMDMEATILAEELIRDYCRESGCALLLITHSLQQACRMADEILFFHRGELLEASAKSKLLSAPEREETRRFLEFYGI